MERLTSLAGISLLLSWCGLTWFGPSFVESSDGVGDFTNIKKEDDNVSCEGNECVNTQRRTVDVPVVRGI